MKTWKKILIGLALVGIVFASGTVVYMFTSIDLIPFPNVIHEKLAINNAYVNGSTIFLDVQAVEGNIAFTGILIKNLTGNLIDTKSISDSILEGQNKTISASLTNTLASGKYVATLTTEKGSSFISPIFNVP
jgi:hypothetical protein